EAVRLADNPGPPPGNHAGRRGTGGATGGGHGVGRAGAGDQGAASPSETGPSSTRPPGQSSRGAPLAAGGETPDHFPGLGGSEPTSGATRQYRATAVRHAG